MFNRDRSIEEMIDSVFNNDDDEIKTNLDEDSITEEYYKAVNELEKYKISSLFVNKFCTSEEAERFEDSYFSLEKKLDMNILDSFFLKFSNNLKKYKILYKAFKKDEEKLLKSDIKIEVKVPKQKIILKEYVNSLSDIITKLEKAIEELVNTTDIGEKIPNKSEIDKIKKLFETAIDSFKKIKYIEIDYEIKELTYKEYIDQSGIELYNLISPINEIFLSSIKKLNRLNKRLIKTSTSKFETIFNIMSLIMIPFGFGILAFIINRLLFRKNRKKRKLNYKTIKSLIKILKISIKSYISLLDGFSNNVKKYVKKYKI
jgi:flagellar biosynthesis/type III secretory pathway chaperone